jgi:hypothetical protein
MRNDEVTLPAYLYNYSSFKNCGRLKKILDDNKLWFSDPTKQNDSFEFRPIFNTGETIGEKRKLEKWVQSVFRKHGANRFERKKLRKIEVQKYRKNPQLLRVAITSNLEKYGMYCFKENPKSILMWAYYGGGHTGYCLKFDTRNTIFRDVKPINYSIRYPIIKPYINNSDEWVKESIRTKAIYWEHECEWRLFSEKHGHVHIPPECLVEIILGYKMDPKCQELIESWCKKHDPSILVSYAIPHDSEYKINIKHGSSGISVLDVRN